MVSEDHLWAAAITELSEGKRVVQRVNHTRMKSLTFLALCIFKRIEWSLMRRLLRVLDHLTSNSAFN